MSVRTPHPIDAHIGKRIRERRKALNLNQKQLARHLQGTVLDAKVSPVEISQ